MDNDYIPSCGDCKYFRKCKEIIRDGSKTTWRYFHICDVLLHSPDPGGFCLVVNKDGCCELWTERTDE